MKNDCGIARDLMPLCIDGTAGESSVRYVDEHVEECAPCAAYYAEMKDSLPTEGAAAQEAEQANFDRAAQKLRKKRRQRVLRNVLIGMAAGIVLLLGGLFARNKLYVEAYPLTPRQDYDVTLAELSDGRMVVTLDVAPFAEGYAYHVDAQPVSGEENRYRLYVYQSAPLLQRELKTIPDPPIPVAIYTLSELTQYAEIWMGAPEADASKQILIWSQGDKVPKASAEMEAYFELEDQMNAIPTRETLDGKCVLADPADQPRYDELEARLEALRETVPEWN